MHRSGRKAARSDLAALAAGGQFLGQFGQEARGRVGAVQPQLGARLIPPGKGCYVGQEVTARMKHKTELRKGLVTLGIDGAAPVGTPILMSDGREAGTLFTQSGGRAIAQMRFDRMGAGLVAGDARIAA